MFWKLKTQRPELKNLLGFLSLAVIILAVFYPVLNGEFLNWDDGFHLKNPDFVGPLNLSTLKNIFFRGIVQDVYIPLTLLSFNMEYNLWGTHPGIYHWDNLMLHIAVSGIIGLIVMQLGFNFRTAALTSLLFGLHPMHVEPVAWSSARKDVLYAFFYALSVYQYILYADTMKRKYLVSSLGLGFFSILAKPMALSLPLILLLIDWFKQRRWSSAVFFEKSLYALYILPLAWVTLSLNIRTMQGTVQEGLLIWIWSLIFYIRQFFLPFEFLLIYQMPEPIHVLNFPYLLSVLLLVLLACSLWLWRQKRIFLFAFFYYFLSVFFLLRYDITAAGDNPVADRYAYLPIFGFCLLAGWGVDFLIEKISRGHPRTGRLFFVVLGMMSILLAGQTRRQCLVWQNSVRLWSHVIRHNPEVVLAYVNRANAYIDQGQMDWADRDYRTAGEIFHKRTHSLVEQSRELARTHKYPGALKAVTKALHMNPDYVAARVIRSQIYSDLGKTDSALADIHKAVALRPRDHILLLLRGNMYGKSGFHELAVKDFTAALAIRPDYALAFHNRARAFFALKKYDLAFKDITQALRLAADLNEAYFIRANIHFEQKQYELALQDYNKILQLSPRRIAALMQRGLTYRHLGQEEKALADFQNVLRQRPRSYEALRQIAEIYCLAEDFKAALDTCHTLIKFYPLRGDLYVKRSGIFAGQGQYKRALVDAFIARNLGQPVPRLRIAELKSCIQQEDGCHLSSPAGEGTDAMP